MSTDAHIPSSRLRAPANLSSFSSSRRQAQQRNFQNGNRSQHSYNALYDFTDSAFRGLMDPTNPTHSNSALPGGSELTQNTLHSGSRLWADARMQREAYYSLLPSDNFRDGQNSRQTNPRNHHLDPMNTSMYETNQDGLYNPSSAMAAAISGNWLDLDRFEDWQRPTLDVLCPDIHIPGEEELFPIAIAEDGETLPSELHPSHPYGDLHQPQLAYSSRFHVLRKNGAANEKAMASAQIDGRRTDLLSGEVDRDLRRLMNDDDEFGGQIDDDELDADGQTRVMEGNDGSDRAADEQNRSDLQSNHHSIALNPPRWPFTRFGPGPGGPNSLLRSELRKPWKPYRTVWSELDLKSLG